jgi:hypothetical protein
MARVRLTRQRFNPVPGTKSTQSRYFLGYFVFVDEPDVGYAVAIRAAAPPRTAGLIKQRALAKAEEYAQKLSDKTQRQVAFMPILPQATKYEAVEHLYGGEGSLRFGGPNARGKVTLSRTRLPNRAVNQTALKSVQAHWESLYGPGAVGQRDWPRASPAFRTSEAYSTGDGSLRFTPYVEPTAEEREAQQVSREQAARLRDRIEKLERVARDQAGMPEGETAQDIADRLRRDLGEAVEVDGYNIPAILNRVELEDTLLNRAWVKGLADLMVSDARTTETISNIGILFLSFIDTVSRSLRRSGRTFSDAEALRRLQTTREFKETRDELSAVGIRTGRQQRELLRRSVDVLRAEGDMPAA